MNGFIKMHRKIINWEWYSDTPTKVAFLHLLLIASHRKTKWQGIDVDPGMAIIGLKKFGMECGLTFQQARTSLKKLESTGEISVKSTNKYTVVTIEKWEDYQLEHEIATNKQQTNNKQATNKQQTNNKQITTSEEYKEYKECKEDKNIPPISPKGESGETLTVKMARGIRDQSMTLIRFNEFWEAYPKKVGKGLAEKCYQKINPSSDLQQEIIKALLVVKQSRQWTMDNGQYIPNPATWLNQRRWEDGGETVGTTDPLEGFARV